MAKANPIQIQKHLHGVDYPASKQDLLAAAKKNKADDETVSFLKKLSDEKFETPADVSKAIGQLNH